MMIKLFLPSSKRLINFSNPFRGRKWLETLTPHQRHGIKFYPNLNYSKETLGFTFRTNSLGLRGKCVPKAPNVLLGTSFAMGLSVDEGANWYQLLLDETSWFNAAMPVGIENSIMVIDDLYEGERNTLIYLYHPNVWRISESYNAALREGKTIFAKQGWKTDRISVLKLYPKWVLKEITKWVIGKSLYCQWNEKQFHFDATYNAFDLDQKRTEFALKQMDLLNGFFGTFNKVIVVRVPIKEDSVPLTKKTRALGKLRAGYDEMWSFFKENINNDVVCHSLDHAKFLSDHFHPYDTHWNEFGNRVFAQRLKNILVEEEISGVAR